MGKGNKRRKSKKNRKQKQYNKRQFVDIFCATCDLCLHDEVDPFFCYQESHQQNPTGFSNVYKNLLKVKDWLHERGITATSIDINRFEAIFCYDLCTDADCELLDSCYEAFQNQIKGDSPPEGKGKQKKRPKKRHVFKPYPTVFTSDDEDWKNKIEEILADGNSDRQQDKIEEGSARAE